MAEDKDTAPRRKTLHELLEITKQKALAVSEAAEHKAAERPAQMFLPGMDEFMRGLPSPMADSSLFAPVARGSKRMHTGSVLASRLNTTLTYWGLQLNELHADITMQLLWEQQRQGVPMGQSVSLNRSALMKAMGWGGSGREYARFHRYMLELTGAMLVIENRKPDGAKKYHIGATKTFRIVDNFECDEGGESYSYRLDPRWIVMFGNREYALIDWSKRQQIGAGQDLAKAMQRLIATSADGVQRYRLDALKAKMQYSGRTRDFKGALSRSMHELERLEIVARYEIGQSSKANEQLTVWLV